MAQALLVGAVLLVGQALFVVCLVLLARRWYERERERVRTEIADALRDLVTAPDENTPSALAVFCDQAAILLASRLMQQVKTTMAGVASGQARNENAAQQLELMQQSPPILAAIAGMLPAKLRNKLLANPQMVGALASMFGGGGNHSGGSSAGGDVRDRFNRA